VPNSCAPLSSRLLDAKLCATDNDSKPSPGIQRAIYSLYMLPLRLDHPLDYHRIEGPVLAVVKHAVGIGAFT
jgi:hypothetical protein